MSCGNSTKIFLNSEKEPIKKDRTSNRGWNSNGKGGVCRDLQLKKKNRPQEAPSRILTLKLSKRGVKKITE